MSSPNPPAGNTVAALQTAAAGLTYQSDTDAPWAAFGWPDATGVPAPAEVKRRGHHKPSAPTAELQVAEFFAPLTADQAWYGAEEKAVAEKYKALLAAVTTTLTRPTVVRVGDRKVTIYVVGQAAEGGWAGLHTTAVET